MAEKSAKRQKKKLEELERYLKTIPPPPPEHTAELKMEKELRRMIKDEKRKKRLGHC